MKKSDTWVMVRQSPAPGPMDGHRVIERLREIAAADGGLNLAAYHQLNPSCGRLAGARQSSFLDATVQPWRGKAVVAVSRVRRCRWLPSLPTLLSRGLLQTLYGVSPRACWLRLKETIWNHARAHAQRQERAKRVARKIALFVPGKLIDNEIV